VTVSLKACGTSLRGFACVFIVLALAGGSDALADDGYWHNASANGVSRTDWMAYLPDSMQLSDLTLPGTHDSGALFGGEKFQTQSMSLATQLQVGLRAFDVRLGRNVPPCVGGQLWVVHAEACERQTFSEVLATITGFLRNHPREVVVMSLKDDTPNTIPDNALDPQFGRSVDAALRSFAPYIWNVDAEPDETWDPRLGEIRGKIVLLQRWTPSADSIKGIPWEDFVVQDDYDQPNKWHLADKWDAVSQQFTAADTGPGPASYVNFLSATGGAFPYFFASGKSSPGTDAPAMLTGWTRGYIDTCSYSGRCLEQYPSVDCFLGTCSVAFEGINQLAEDRIQATQPTRLGIVFADFPGPGSSESPGLVGTLISADYRYTAGR
jgi:1-phosphatidylinositol phosphodiesterase